MGFCRVGTFLCPPIDGEHRSAFDRPSPEPGNELMTRILATFFRFAMIYPSQRKTRHGKE